jgi:hypothetical protein
MDTDRVTVRLTDRARRELRPGEALVFDWHRVAMCCAAAGETSLRRTTLREATRSRAFLPVGDPAGGEQTALVFAHRQVAPHLAGRTVTVDCRRHLGMRHFSADLPPDFGLRASLGRLRD